MLTSLEAWSGGEGERCKLWPTSLGVRWSLLLASVAFVLLAAGALEVLWAPLAIVDAHTLEGKGKDFVITVQGPICQLPKRVAQWVHRSVAYSFEDTGLHWLQAETKNSPPNLLSLGHAKLQLPQQLQPPYACATSRGFLQAADYWRLLFRLWLLFFFVIPVPTAIVVAVLSGNHMQHVLVTIMAFALPLALLAAALHPALAWLLRRQRTPLQDAHEEYLSKIRVAGPSVERRDHPKDHGIAAGALFEFWEHFQRFLLDRNMHFVVSNIVLPLTAKKKVSFVDLLGSRRVDFFVSHSWGTPFQHFVKCIRRHASFAGAPDAAYWICSLANNQWDVEGALGTDVMESAFARVLLAGVRGVVMVLDAEVQPLTRNLASMPGSFWQCGSVYNKLVALLASRGNI